MDPKNKRNSGGGNNNKNLMGIVSIVLWALIIVLMVNYVTSMATTRQSTEIDYSEFVQMVRDDKVAWVVMESNKYTIYPKPDAAAQTQSARPETADSPIPGLEGLMQSAESGTDQWKQQLKSGPSYYCAPIASDSEIAHLIPLMEEHGVVYGPPYVEQLSPIISLLISYVLPVIIMVVLFSFLFRNMSSKMGGGLGGVGKANAKVYVEKKTGVTFRDVAGQDEAKESLEEIIDILHNPQKYTEIGAKLPKGALLVGPPGTGKTLLAKAVAGEAGVPFFSISGSDFVEMFVGVGASRVRDLFKEASKMAPCIIFIDEIDTIGKSRDNRLGGNDEREQTLNQLLAELDGFDPTKGVIVLAATNRPEVLDQALLRPGRFDRRITVDRPNLAGRVATLQVHTRNIRLSEDVDLNKIAQATAGAVGADLASPGRRKRAPSSPSTKRSWWPITRWVTPWWLPSRRTPSPSRKSPSFPTPRGRWALPSRPRRRRSSSTPRTRFWPRSGSVWAAEPPRSSSCTPRPPAQLRISSRPPAWPSTWSPCTACPTSSA